MILAHGLAIVWISCFVWSDFILDLFFGCVNQLVFMVIIVFVCFNVLLSLQCFDAVGWVAGRASGL